MVCSEKKVRLGKLGFAIDRGGTFTDIVCCFPCGKIEKLKLLSEDPAKYESAPTEGIRRFLELFTENKIGRNETIPTENIEWIRMGTTVATNALLEKKGERSALIITKGFKDILHIGNQTRPDLFDLRIDKPEAPCEQIVEIDERVIVGTADIYRHEELKICGKPVKNGPYENMFVEKEIDVEELRKVFKNLKEQKFNSIAVSLMNAYAYPENENLVNTIAEEFDFGHISISHKVNNMTKFVPRTYTVITDAYLTPVVKTYIDSFKKNFANNLREVNLEFMRSDGGLCTMSDFIGSRAILSGPAGGVVGVSITAFDKQDPQPVIGFDMGGTSTDVSRYNGSFEQTLETQIAGLSIQVPQMDILTVAAGGGSRLFFRDGRFIVGPESAGSDPGPICYRKNGYLTITDANVILKKVVPEHFPKIFGPNGDLSLDYDSSYKAFVELTKQVNEHIKTLGKPEMCVESVAEGFINVANETMCRPIRNLTEGKGHNTASHVLASFGGGGGQHACAVAEKLGITKIKISPHSGLLSAYGIGAADTVVDELIPYGQALDESKGTRQFLTKAVTDLFEKNVNKLLRSGFCKDDIKNVTEAHFRYLNTDSTIPIIINHTNVDYENLISVDELEIAKDTFERIHEEQFGFAHHHRKVIIQDIRTISSAKRFSYPEISLDTKGPSEYIRDEDSKCWFNNGWHETKCVHTKNLSRGNIISGPALLLDANCTIVVDPNCEAVIEKDGSVTITIEDKGLKKIGVDLNPIHLSIFSHRLMSIAEQMGKVLQRTAISTNIKERLDFSCALFGTNGDLIANAPHIPVHLGGMQTAVKYLINLKGRDGIKPGESVISNHPKEGGSHLPDLTIITPIYISNQTYPDFYVANRGHHSDIGGLCPGSMPPNSSTLLQEGAIFKDCFTIVEGGKFLEQKVTDQLMKPAEVAGCTGTRQLTDNLADLKAQIAANKKGIDLLKELCKEYGIDVVQAYMAHITENADLCVRNFLKSQKSSVLEAIDHMDDGTAIKLKITIDKEDGSAIFDFTGTGPQSKTNLNAPEGVTKAAVIYCIRCMVGREIPLNQGCLNPIKIIIPQDTILNPGDEAAVVGGNVLTSQRLCDVILAAFEACAASQGCMNNITFGSNLMGGYYETISGGAGATPDCNGRSGVHTHMTNTRITDPEIVETRYPVIVRQFALREHSGGLGKHHGGDGVIRELQFRVPVTLSVLTERRKTVPFGICGGQNALPGINLLQSIGKEEKDIGGKATIDIKAGDTLKILTPGGGGFGLPEN
uniref:5-oxoprolinase n=1 Tax=Rhabditophanes sp. KR3021 TaxID=114890 RepID=A0AC35U4K0_9BILA